MDGYRQKAIRRPPPKGYTFNFRGLLAILTGFAGRNRLRLCTLWELAEIRLRKFLIFIEEIGKGIATIPSPAGEGGTRSVTDEVCLPL